VTGEQVLTLAGSPNGPTTLDPALIRDAESAFVARQIFRGLVRLDDDLVAQPDLASRIEIAADGLLYTFHLRENAVFHDGTPIDAQAVADSLNRACDPSLAGGDGMSLAAAIYLIDIDGARERLEGTADRISGIVVRDERTLDIRLARPAASFLYKLTGPPAMVVDVASARDGDWWQSPNGSGPFELEPYAPGGTLTLLSFDDFYEGAPALSEVRILGGSDALQPLNLYEGGEIDVTDVPYYSLDRVLSPSDPLNAELIVEPQLSTSFIVMNENVAPFDQLELRLAIAHAFDREKVERVMFESKVRLADGLVPPDILGRDWVADIPAYDLNESRSLLATVDLGERRPAIYEPGAGISGALKAVLARDLGLDIDVIDLEWPEFSTLLTERTMPAYVLSWIADYPDPENFLTSMFHSQSPDNYTGYANPNVDRLLDEASIEPDAEARAELYLRAQQAIIDDGVLVPLYHDVSYTLIKPYVHGLTISPVGILGLDRVWIET
jgi:peptide/nickel transport system substrate-binding protein/oligopeptide transport system substrate-binding protein